MRLNNRQAVFTAYFIGQAAYAAVVCGIVAAKFSAVHKGDGVEYYVAMNVLMVCMRTDYGFKSVSDELLRKFNAQLMGTLRTYFAGRIRVNEMVAENAAGLVPTVFCRLHISVGGRNAAVECSLQDMFTIGCFFTVERIVDAVIQTAVNGNYFVVCHYTLSFTKRHARRASSAASCISAGVLPL